MRGGPKEPTDSLSRRKTKAFGSYLSLSLSLLLSRSNSRFFFYLAPTNPFADLIEVRLYGNRFSSSGSLGLTERRKIDVVLEKKVASFFALEYNELN